MTRAPDLKDLAMTSLAIVAAVLALSLPADLNLRSHDVAAPVAERGPVAPLDQSLVTPGVPRAVEGWLVGSEVIVRWAPPATSGATPLEGYMVLRSLDEPLFVPAGATTVTIPALPGQQISVAALNQVACSLSVPAVMSSAGIRSASRRLAR